MKGENKVLVILGQTASGKKKIAEAILERHTEVIFVSADSRKIYKYMDIGTDKPQGKLREHYTLIDIKHPCEQYSAEEFRKDAERVIKRAYEENKIPVVVGGTPLYLLALFEGFFEHEKDENIRRMLDEKLEKEGVGGLYRELMEVDPKRAEKLNPNDAYRIKRALEVYYTTGIPMSDLMKKRKPPLFSPLYIGIRWDRKLLYERINSRVERMIENGLLDEVKKLVEMGIDENCPGMKTIGYREMLEFIKGNITFEEAVRKIKKNTRIYARRQEYFFKHFQYVKWLFIQDFDNLYYEIDKVVNWFKTS